MIFFCWASLEETVYVMGGGGFTAHVDKFVEADGPERARSAYQDYLEKKGIRVRKVTASVARQQDKARYVFPENILNALHVGTTPTANPIAGALGDRSRK